VYSSPYLQAFNIADYIMQRRDVRREIYLSADAPFAAMAFTLVGLH
jgi:hypothetical protein